MDRGNRQLVLAHRPLGLVADDDFELREVQAPTPGPGEALLRVCWLSFDPTKRGWLNDVPGYMPPVQIGEVMRAGGVGQVVESNTPELAPGDFVTVTNPAGNEKFTYHADPTRESPDAHAKSGDSGFTVHRTKGFGAMSVDGDTAVVTARLWEKYTTKGRSVDQKLWFSDTYIRTPAGWTVGSLESEWLDALNNANVNAIGEILATDFVRPAWISVSSLQRSPFLPSIARI